MTTRYQYMTTVPMNGFTAVRLTLEQETPLGMTYQSEQIYVQAYHSDDAKKKAERLLKGSVSKLIEYVAEPAESTGGYGTRLVAIGDVDYHIPQHVYDKIAEDAIAEEKARLERLGITFTAE